MYRYEIQVSRRPLYRIGKEVIVILLHTMALPCYIILSLKDVSPKSCNIQKDSPSGMDKSSATLQWNELGPSNDAERRLRKVEKLIIYDRHIVLCI